MTPEQRDIAIRLNVRQRREAQIDPVTKQPVECRAKARRRAEGIKCAICGVGPCQAAMSREACEPFTTGSHYLDELLFDTTWCVPNRLYGVTITPEGDAI